MAQVHSRSEPGPAEVAIVREELATIPDPCSIATGVPISLVDMGIVKTVEAVEDRVHVVFQLTAPVCLQVGLIAETLDARCRARGVRVSVEVDPDSEWMPHLMNPESRRQLRALRPLPISPIEKQQPEED